MPFTPNPRFTKATSTYSDRWGNIYSITQLQVNNEGLAGVQFEAHPDFEGVTIFRFADPGSATFILPTVTLNPVGATPDYGETVTLAAAGTGFPAPVFQWQRSIDGGSTFSNISGALGTSYTTPPMTDETSGYRYRASLTNYAGTVYTNAAIITVLIPPAPTISSHPSNQTVTVGNNATFSASASGVVTSTQWQENISGTWTNMSGKTASPLVLTGLTLADTGRSFRVVFTNPGGSATSNAATLTVNDVSVPIAPTVAISPESDWGAINGTDVVVDIPLTLTGDAPDTVAIEYRVDASANPTGSYTAISSTLQSTSGGYAWYRVVMPSLTANHYLQYRVTATNGGGSDSDESRVVRVNFPWYTALSYPSSLVDSASTAFSVTLASTTGTAPTYIWRYESSPGSWSPWGGGDSDSAEQIGVTTKTLTYPAFPVRYSGRTFRLEVTKSGIGTVVVKTITPTVTNPTAHDFALRKPEGFDYPAWAGGNTAYVGIQTLSGTITLSSLTWQYRLLGAGDAWGSWVNVTSAAVTSPSTYSFSASAETALPSGASVPFWLITFPANLEVNQTFEIKASYVSGGHTMVRRVRMTSYYD